MIFTGGRTFEYNAETKHILMHKMYYLTYDASTGRFDQSLEEADAASFTLYGRVKHSNRPDFMRACPADRANEYFELFKRELSAFMPVQSGVFGAHMHIEAENDGPVTLVIDSSEL